MMCLAIIGFGGLCILYLLATKKRQHPKPAPLGSGWGVFRKDCSGGGDDYFSVNWEKELHQEMRRKALEQNYERK